VANVTTVNIRAATSTIEVRRDGALVCLEEVDVGIDHVERALSSGCGSRIDHGGRVKRGGGTSG